MGRYNLETEAAATDAELSGIIAKLDALNQSEIAALLPKRHDQDELERLIQAVNDAMGENNKKKVLSKSLGVLSSVVKDVVLKLV